MIKSSNLGGSVFGLDCYVFFLTLKSKYKIVGVGIAAGPLTTAIFFFFFFFFFGEGGRVHFLLLNGGV